jgi:CheY-like chemotaxis protein
LIVDDNADAAESLSMLLLHNGHEVRTAHDGLTGIEQTAMFDPDVILLDLGMPGMDGFETARKVRQLKGMKQIKIVALTGWGQDEDRRRTKEAGFDAHLVKPVDSATLKELLASI